MIDNDKNPFLTLEEKEFIKEKNVLIRYVSKQIKKLERKEGKLLEKLDECALWKKVRHEGDLMKSNLSSIKRGSDFANLYDWTTDQTYTLALNPAKSPQEEMTARYKKAGKLERGIFHLTKQLELTRQQMNALKNQQEGILSIQNLPDLISFKKILPPLTSSGSKIELKASSAIYKEYESVLGVKIWVGKSANFNDKLTFQLANGRDWWLHVRNCPGSHVIIRMRKNQEEPDSETLKDAMQLALYHSKARLQGEGEVCYTQRKYVARLGRKKGLVQISKHQTAWIRLNERLARLLKKD